MMLVNLRADPQVTIQMKWPDRQYLLINAATGCPTGWCRGWRHQDGEDSGNRKLLEPTEYQ